ncbi:MAG TPA: FAD-dependent oxidoreductase [Gemmatimonadaceae bacterium]
MQIGPREPKRMIVIGGGYIGLELGLVYHKLGTEIRVLEFMDRVLPGMEEDLSKDGPLAEEEDDRGAPETPLLLARSGAFVRKCDRSDCLSLAPVWAAGCCVRLGQEVVHPLPEKRGGTGRRVRRAPCDCLRSKEPRDVPD